MLRPHTAQRQLCEQRLRPARNPITNIALSSTEDVAAIGLTWFATHHPFILAAFVALGLLVAAILAVRALLRAIHKPLRKLFGMEQEGTKPQPKPLKLEASGCS